MTQRNHGSFSLFSFQGTPSFFLRRTSRRRFIFYHTVPRKSTRFFWSAASNFILSRPSSRSDIA